MTMMIAHIKHYTSYRMFMSIRKINRHKVHPQTLYVLRERERELISTHIEQIIPLMIGLCCHELKRKRELAKCIDMNEIMSAFY